MANQNVPVDGVYVVHSWDHGIEVKSVHDNPFSAIAAAESWDEIKFLRWGVSVELIEKVQAVVEDEESGS